MSDSEILKLVSSLELSEAEGLGAAEARLWLEKNADLEAIMDGLVARKNQPPAKPAMPANPSWKDMLTRPVQDLLRGELAKMPVPLRNRGRKDALHFQEIRWDDALGAWRAELPGEDRYEVWVNPVGRSSCTCTYHAENDVCSHLSGFFTRLLQEAAPPLPPLVAAAEIPAPRPVEPPRAVKPVAPEPGDFEKIAALAARLVEPSAEGDNERMQLVYLLARRDRAGKHNRCGTPMDVVPRKKVFHNKSGWTVEPADFRLGLGDRLKTHPPKFLGDADIALVEKLQELSKNPWEPAGTPFQWQTTMALAAATERLVDEDGIPLGLDPDLWKWEPLLDAEGAVACFRRRIRSLDEPSKVVALAPDAVVFGQEQDAMVRSGAALYRLDPRTPMALLDGGLETVRVAKRDLSKVRRELSIFARSGASIASEYLPELRRETPQARLSIEVREEYALLTAIPWYPSLGAAPSSPSPRVAFTLESGDLAELERDLPAEAAMRQKLLDDLAASGVPCEKDGGSAAVSDSEGLRTLALTGLQALQDKGWTPHTQHSLDRWKRRKGQIRIRVRDSGQDWFELDGIVDFDGFQAPISTLIESSGRLTLEDGSVAELPKKLLRRLEWLGALGKTSKDGIRLDGAHAPLVQDLLQEDLVGIADLQRWRTLLTDLSAKTRTVVDAPASLKASLRPYQLEGFRWLSSLREQKLGAILADDMGLGKTVQVIAHLCHLFATEKDAKPALVVAPASVVGNWASELARFAPHLHVRLLHGSERDEMRDAPIEGPTIFVTTYGILPREGDWLDESTFSVMILDESQTVRNPQTVSHRMAVSIQADQKICLTGTPIENSIADLWAQFAVLNPGLLGPMDAFLEQFEPDGDEPPDLARLRALTAPFWLRRTKELVASDLPRRQDIELGIDLDPKQMALYQRQLQEFQKTLLPVVQSQGMEGSTRFDALTALLRLRQIACAPELAGHSGPSAKLDVLMEKLSEDVAEGHKALVFSSFTSLLDLVGRRLQKASIPFLRIDGKTSTRERTQLIERFQSKQREDVFLVSLKAGGAGINLTAADYVFLLDPWWNPAAEEQAAARAHRIGQDRPVTVYRMVARGTIEERVLALSRTKAALARDVFDSGESGGAMLTADVIAELLG